MSTVDERGGGGGVVTVLISALKEEYSRKDNFIETRIGTWIADTVLHGTKSWVEYRDTGYDVSDYAHTTHTPYNVDEFSDVGDFLDEPTGNTLPTFESGHGFRAERYSDTFDFEVLDAIGEWRERYFLAHFTDLGEDLLDLVRDEFWEAVANDFLDGFWWHDYFAKKPLREIVQKYRVLAEQANAERERIAAASAIVDAAERATAARVDAHFRMLLGGRKAKFNKPEMDKVIELLNSVHAKLGVTEPEGVTVYVRSGLFKALVSNSLFDAIAKRYPRAVH